MFVKMQKNLYLLTTYQLHYQPLSQIELTMQTEIMSRQNFTKVLSTRESLLLVVEFLDNDDLQHLFQAIQDKHINLENESVNIVRSAIFTRTYLNKVDRSMSYFLYQHPIIKNIDRTSIEKMAENSHEQIQEISGDFVSLFKDLKLKCEMIETEVQVLRKIVTEPDLPLPVTIRSSIGKYCSSNLQLFVCSKIVHQESHFDDEDDAFGNFKQLLASNEQQYIKSILKSANSSEQVSILQAIQSLYENPALFVQRIKQMSTIISSDNHIFNFFIIMIKIAKNMINAIKLRLKSLESDPFSYFTELLLRYSIFKNFVLQLENTLGSVLKTFQTIVQDALNIHYRQFNNGGWLSLWKVLINIFAKQMDSEVENCLPIYMTLLEKLKINQNNEAYLKTQKIHESEKLDEKFENSPVLKYLIDADSIDNLHVFLSDFMEMLVDLSFQQNNVLLCGSSQQKLQNKNFEKLQNQIIQHQKQIIETLLDKFEISKVRQTIEQEFSFLEKSLSVKRRTLKLLLNQFNAELITIDFETVDNQLNQTNKKYFKQTEDLYSSQKTYGSTLTADSDQTESQFDFEGLEYFSEVDEEQIIQEIDF